MFDNHYIDELIQMRIDARERKDWKLSDQIRDYLDTKNVFCFDTANGQETYHLCKPILSRDEAVEKIKELNLKPSI